MIIIAGPEDTITRWTDAERLAREVARPVELPVIEGANRLARNRLLRHRTRSADRMAERLSAR